MLPSLSISLLPSLVRKRRKEYPFLIIPLLLSLVTERREEYEMKFVKTLGLDGMDVQ